MHHCNYLFVISTLLSKKPKKYLYKEIMQQLELSKKDRNYIEKKLSIFEKTYKELCIEFVRDNFSDDLDKKHILLNKYSMNDEYREKAEQTLAISEERKKQEETVRKLANDIDVWGAKEHHVLHNAYMYKKIIHEQNLLIMNPTWGYEIRTNLKRERNIFLYKLKKFVPRFEQKAKEIEEKNQVFFNAVAQYKSIKEQQSILRYS